MESFNSTGGDATHTRVADRSYDDMPCGLKGRSELPMNHPMTSSHDYALRMAKAGERRGLEELWKLYQPQLVRFLRARLGEAGDDVASTVWIDVARSLHRFEGERDDFRRWLYTIAHRRAVDHIRRCVRRIDAETRQGAQPAAQSALPDPLSDALALLQLLPDDMSEALLLRVVADLSVSETAAVMGKTESNVRILTHRGLERLRRRLVVGGDARDENRFPVMPSPVPAMKGAS
jgi:RNA polymerase sigma-70 factor (ECF subfamily)